MIDIQKGSHVVAFPTKVASAMGNYGHVYNIVVVSNTLDNGALAGRGEYVAYDQYKQAAAPNGFTGVIRGKAPAQKDAWEVEVTAVSASADTLFIYNAPVSEYAEKDLQDEALFYNKKDEVAQGMSLIVGDVITISTNGFNGTPQAGKNVTFASGKYVVAQAQQGGNG